MSVQSKIIPFNKLSRWRDHLPFSQTVAVTNGCFDLLHAGHVLYLDAAKELADVLLVGINSDHSVRRLKGPDRPVTPEQERSIILAGLASVDAVTIFPPPDPIDFLLLSSPTLYVKGGDYTLDTINQEERRLLESIHVPIIFLTGFPGLSTSSILKKLPLIP